jgi:hypothetical protein
VCSIHEYISNIIRVEYTNRGVDVACVGQSEARDTMKLLQVYYTLNIQAYYTLACVGQSEARDTMKLLKLLPPDVSAELIEVVCV